MKTPNYIYNFLFLGLIAVALFTTTACQSNSSGGNVAARNRTNSNGGVVGPNGTVLMNQDWGQITDLYNSQIFDPNLIQTFVYGASNIGQVSGTGNGIQFTGAIDQMNGTGTIGIKVTDSYATQGQLPFYWTLNVDHVLGDASSATVTAVDGDGAVTFEGQWVMQNNVWYWRGVVHFQMSPAAGGARGDLGNFVIRACGIFSC